MEQSIVFRFFGGVSQAGFDWAVDFERVLFELARWLLPIGVCLLAEGLCVEKWRKIEQLSCCRYETVKRWWRRKYGRSLLYGILTAAVLFLAAMAADFVCGVELPGETGKVFLLWFAHMATVLSCFLVLDQTRLRRFAPALLLVLEGVTFLAGFQSPGAARFLYGMWGMYFQSGWHFGETGVPPVCSLAAEGVLLAFGYLAGEVLLKREVLAHGGNDQN